MVFRRPSIPESKIYYLLSNPRRRHAIRYLQRQPGTVTVRELSEAIAEIESGESPPPRNVRETVYTSLSQTHLPALEAQGVVEYDPANREVIPLSRTRAVRIYMEVVTRYGLTWAECYRYLGIIGLCLVVTSLAGVAPVSLVDPLLWASGFLALFALTTALQLWKDRFAIRRRFFEQKPR
jgi:hypothetical protein